MKSFQNQIKNHLISDQGKLVSKRCTHSWLSKNFKEYNEILELTNFLSNGSITQRLWHAYKGIYKKSQCKTCGKECNFVGFWDGYLDHCCNSCAQKNDETQKKIQKTSLERYGTNHSLSSEKIKKKRLKTVREKYGVNNVSQLNEVKKKKETTSLKNNGASCILKNKTLMKESLIKKYNVDNIMKVPSISKKAGLTRRSDFYDKMFSTNRLMNLSTPMFSKDEYINNGYYFHYKFKCSTCNNIFEDCLEDGDIPKCPHCFKTKSTFEFEVSNYIKSIYNGPILENDRTILQGKEIDIYLPNEKIGIECNGLFWHGENNGKDKYYHTNKSKDCLDKGIRLIHLYDDEWNLKCPVVKKYLSKLLLNDDHKVYARECSVKDLDPKMCNEFLENNHFQGKDNSSIKLGLFYKGELISVMTFGKSRFEKSNAYEIYRYCSEKNVIGGFSKLLSHFKKLNLTNKLITYSDISKFTGRVYMNNGFTKIKITEPGYWYFSRKKYYRQHRFNFRKTTMENKIDCFDNNLSEYENMKNNGYDRIWDCGNLKFEYIY